MIFATFDGNDHRQRLPVYNTFMKTQPLFDENVRKFFQSPLAVVCKRCKIPSEIEFPKMKNFWKCHKEWTFKKEIGMEQIKDRLKQLRHAVGIKQRELADRLEVQVGLIGNWESGARNIPKTRIYQICKEYNVREEWLKTGEGEMFEPEPEPEETSFEDEMYKMYQQLSPEYQEVWKNLAELILNGKPTDESIREGATPKPFVNAVINGDNNEQNIRVSKNG